jgi:hypothetical protein
MIYSLLQIVWTSGSGKIALKVFSIPGMETDAI